MAQALKEGPSIEIWGAPPLSKQCLSKELQAKKRHNRVQELQKAREAAKKRSLTSNTGVFMALTEGHEFPQVGNRSTQTKLEKQAVGHLQVELPNICLCGHTNHLWHAAFDCPRMGADRSTLVNACLATLVPIERAHLENKILGKITQTTFAPGRLGIAKDQTKAFYEKAAQEWEAYWQKYANQRNTP